MHGDVGKAADVSIAEFGEWPLENAVLKSMIVDNQATFQIQFAWDCCVEKPKTEIAIASETVTRSSTISSQSGSSRTTATKRKALNRPTGKKSRVKGSGHVLKTDTQGKSYDAWRFECILDSRQCSDASDEVEYKVKWTSPWPATWEPAQNLRDNPEELRDFHLRMPEKPGPPGWVREAVEKE